MNVFKVKDTDTRATSISFLDKGRKLSIREMFERRFGRLLNVPCTFNLRPLSRRRLSLLLFLNNQLLTQFNFQSMKSPVELNSLFSKFFCYITWFVISPDQTRRRWTTCKQGLYVKSYCYFETIAQRFKNYKLYWKTNKFPHFSVAFPFLIQ